MVQQATALFLTWWKAIWPGMLWALIVGVISWVLAWVAGAETPAGQAELAKTSPRLASFFKLMLNLHIDPLALARSIVGVLTGQFPQLTKVVVPIVGVLAIGAAMIGCQGAKTALDFLDDTCIVAKADLPAEQIVVACDIAQALIPEVEALLNEFKAKEAVRLKYEMTHPRLPLQKPVSLWQSPVVPMEVAQ